MLIHLPSSVPKVKPSVMTSKCLWNLSTRSLAWGGGGGDMQLYGGTKGSEQM